MAGFDCDLTKGRGLGGCLTTTGGVKYVYFCAYEPAVLNDAQGGAFPNSLIDTIDGITTLFRYSMKRGAGGLTEAVAASAENGTVFYTPTVTVKLHKLTKEDQNELKLIAQNTLICFVELNEVNAAGKNVIIGVGTDAGCTISGGTNSAGMALGDFNGYEWTFEANQSYPMCMVKDYALTPFDNITTLAGPIAIDGN
tara:strand:- start:21519 stop:22109 length:591 start_codon:yes stop_codon:yes gene_type:complete